MKKNIAIFFYGLGDFSGGGGAERFFAGFLKDYQQSSSNLFKLSLLTDRGSFEQLKKVINQDLLQNVYLFKVISNRFKYSFEFAQILFLLLTQRIQAIQVPLYGSYYFPLIKKIDSLPGWIRPKIIIIITDSFLPYYYFNTENKKYDFKSIFGRLFEEVRIDAIISWYELFDEFATKYKIIKSNPIIHVIKSRYTTKIFDNSIIKKNNIIFASRLTEAKKPLMFLDAIKLLKQRGVVLNNWRFLIYGKGELEQKIKDEIFKYNLNDIVFINFAPDLTMVMSESKCFVSTMDYENFPSLSMNEAMAAGNAIIARNVGQTHLFVRHMKNGILIEPDNTEGLSNAIEYFIKHPEMHETMALESIRLTKTEHTFKNFKFQMEGFWSEILNVK